MLEMMGVFYAILHSIWVDEANREICHAIDKIWRITRKSHACTREANETFDALSVHHFTYDFDSIRLDARRALRAMADH